MVCTRSLARPLPTLLLLFLLALAAGAGPTARGIAAPSAASAEAARSSRASEAAAEAPGASGLRSSAPAEHETRSRPQLLARAWALPVPPVAALGARPLQQGGLEIYSEPVAGCARIEGAPTPTLDCSVVVAERFEARFGAQAIGGEVESSRLRLVLLPPLPGTSLERLDSSGQALPGPVEAKERVDARLRFEPEAGQESAPDEPWMVELLAERRDGSGNLVASTRVRLRLHVLPLAGAHLLGYVFEDRDGDGQRDVGEPGLADWPLQLSGWPMTATDAFGRFVWTGLPAGAYQLDAEGRDGWRATRPSTLQLQVEEGRAVDVLFGMRRSQTDARVGARLQTDRGCVEDGRLADYEPGETMQVFLEAQGLPEVDLTLTRHGGAGVETLLERRRVPGAQTFSFRVDAGGEPGQVELRLSAFAPDALEPAATVGCSYRIQAAEGPRLGYAPSLLDFGSVPPGGRGRAELTLRNEGAATLVLGGLSIQGGSGAAFGLVSVGLQGLSLEPGQSQVLELDFAPRAAGPQQDFLILRSNDGRRPLISIPLHGIGTASGAGLSGYLRTDRGCLESQDDPLYFVGDPIALRLRVDGPPGGSADARIEDITPDGRTRVVFQRGLPLNQELRLNGAQVLPPVGVETLRLTAHAGNELLRRECSFRVAAGGTRIVGYKFEDRNGNGIWEGCPSTPWIPGEEPAVPGWGITLTGPESQTVVTDASGRYEFVVSTPGTYYLTEEQRAGWRPTRPATVALDLQCHPGEQVPEVYFGNQRLGACDPGKAPCPPGPTPPGGPTPTPPAWPSPTPPAWPSPTPPVWPSPTAAGPTPTAAGPPGPTAPPPPPPPVCYAQISPRPSLMNVGQLAEFDVAVTGGGVVTGYQWSISGEVIRDYSELTRQSWSVTPMTAADFQGRRLSFYWKPEANQRHPQNAGPQPRTVSVTVTTVAGQCSAEHVLNVERNNTSLARQAEDFYTANHQTAILTEHTLWHSSNPFAGWGYDGTLFFDFHRQYLNRFNSWRSEFGYPPLGIWDSGTSIPRGIEIDHAARGGFYAVQPKPSWFGLNGVTARPGNGLPCDTSRGGERNLRDYPANRRLLGCAVTHPWHNAVHTAIGGDMLNPQFSPRDPIFWRWHGFVDIVSQERMGVLASLLQGASPRRLADLLRPLAPDDQRRPPFVVYQEPFRLYRFLDGLERFVVEFDQPVAGVTADDLRVAGWPATEVQRLDAQRYAFRGFPEPGLGRLEVELRPGGIRNLYNVEFEGERWRYHIVDPDIDQDRDGLVSRVELDVTLSSPIDRDSDDDGLSDGDEVRLYGTRPLLWDSDRDGANDHCEVERGTDPLDPADAARGCPVGSIVLPWAARGLPDR